MPTQLLHRDWELRFQGRATPRAPTPSSTMPHSFSFSCSVPRPVFRPGLRAYGKGKKKRRKKMHAHEHTHTLIQNPNPLLSYGEVYACTFPKQSGRELILGGNENSSKGKLKGGGGQSIKAPFCFSARSVLLALY